MNFCTACGSSLSQSTPSKSMLCRCGHQNIPESPKIMVSAFVNCGPRLLWMRRAYPPQAGFWALPSGFMEQEESLAEASARELFEETQVKLDAAEMHFYMIGTISYISQVYVAFRATVAEQCGGLSHEALELGWFSKEELPWDEVAYPSANHSIEQAYADIERGQFDTYHAIMTETENRLEPISID